MSLGNALRHVVVSEAPSVNRSVNTIKIGFVLGICKNYLGRNESDALTMSAPCVKHQESGWRGVFSKNTKHAALIVRLRVKEAVLCNYTFDLLVE